MTTAPADTTAPGREQVMSALAGVQDPEIHRPITDLGMVKDIEIGAGGAVRVDVWLTVAGCPLRETITRDVTAAGSRRRISRSPSRRRSPGCSRWPSVRAGSASRR